MPTGWRQCQPDRFAGSRSEARTARSGCLDSRWWDGVYVREPRRDDRGFKVRRVIQRSAEAEGTVLIEGIHQTFAHAIIDNPESATDAGFAVLRARSPGKSNARAKIMSIPIVVTRFAVGASRPVVRDQRLLVRRNPLRHAHAMIVEPRAKAESRSHLQAIGFPGR